MNIKIKISGTDSREGTFKFSVSSKQELEDEISRIFEFCHVPSGYLADIATVEDIIGIRFDHDKTPREEIIKSALSVPEALLKDLPEGPSTNQPKHETPPTTKEEYLSILRFWASKALGDLQSGRSKKSIVESVHEAYSSIASTFCASSIQDQLLSMKDLDEAYNTVCKEYVEDHNPVSESTSV